MNSKPEIEVTPKTDVDGLADELLPLPECGDGKCEGCGKSEDECDCGTDDDE